VDEVRSMLALCKSNGDIGRRMMHLCGFCLTRERVYRRRLT
jgi:hypothetical protein